MLFRWYLTSKRPQLIIISPLQLDFCHCHCPISRCLKRPGARGALTHASRNIVAPKLHRIEQEPSDSPPHYFWDKPLARPLWQIGNLAASHNLSFSFTRGKGSFASRPSRHQLSVARFAKLSYSWRPQNVWGEKPVHATLHATSRVF